MMMVASLGAAKGSKLIHALNRAKALSTSRRIASGREGLSGWTPRQLSSAETVSGRSMALIWTPRPIAGRPRFFSRFFS